MEHVHCVSKHKADGILLFVRNRVQKRYANRIDNIFVRAMLLIGSCVMKKETNHDLTIFL
jgi:hypothetical protein